MKLFVIERGARVEVFDDPVAEALILGEPLPATQRRAAQRAGLEIERVGPDFVPSPPCFVMEESIFVTGRYLAELVRRAKEGGVDAIAGVAEGGRFRTHGSGHPRARKVPGGHTYALRFLAGRGPERPILIDMDDALELSTVALPRAIHPTRSFTFAESTRGIVDLQAPLHVYQANMHANVERGVEQLLRARLAASRGREVAENEVGPDCFIHPTAEVVGCRLGAGVSIGPFASVRQSVIGEGASVMDGARVMKSVIGAHSMVSLQHRVVQSVLYPECILVSGALQFSILGRESGAFATWVTDLRMDGKTIRTPVGGALVDSGMKFLGVIAGHRAKLTAGVITAPGRVVPSGTEVHATRSIYAGLPADHPPGAPYFLN